MNRILRLLLLTGIWIQMAQAQIIEHVYLDTTSVSINPINTDYKPSRKIEVDISHIRLEVTPKIAEKSLHGKAYLHMNPYNQPIESFELDAKGMEIGQVAMVDTAISIPLEYSYDDLKLRIELPRPYSKKEPFTVMIEYISNPYKLAVKGIEVSSGRGMYFIDVDDSNPYKPTQVWTQGETKSASVWFPSVDAPNQFFTQEIQTTVDTMYSTLSNGLLKSTVIHDDGTKTDQWVQDKPHGPHLTMLAIGEFAITQDEWRSLEVSYYTTEAYSKDVEDIFGVTPTMMSFYSELFGVDYPWEKYAQVVVYDFSSGAMENTSASLYSETYYADRFDKLDYNYDETIAHELVHQWFGNLVACESWAHLTLNESFATYGEYFWFDHQYSRDHADHLQHNYLHSYLDESVYKIEPIVNFYYDDPEDLFDGHRYDKGSCVLHMLRDYVGDEHFFQGLNHYLQTHKFQSAEISDFRKSMEAVTGEDLYWFFDQWFKQAGHPEVSIQHQYDSKEGILNIYIEQHQDINRFTTFRFPLSIDIYLEDTVIRQEVRVNDRMEHLRFHTSSKPLLVNVDARKVMLWDKEDIKPKREWMELFQRGKLFVDRKEALSHLVGHQSDQQVRELFVRALSDPFWHIREYAIRNLNLNAYRVEEDMVSILKQMALDDPSADVRHAALELMEEYRLNEAVPTAERLFMEDSSRMVQSAALRILYADDAGRWIDSIPNLDVRNNYHLAMSIGSIYALEAEPEYHEFFKRSIWMIREYRIGPIMSLYIDYLAQVEAKELHEGALFLSVLYQDDESDYKRNAARNALYDLEDIFNRRSADDEKAGILRAVVNGLKD